MNRFPIAILAGGMATRLGHLSRHMPKSLIEVAGRPFIHHQLGQLRNQGVDRVVLCLGHLGEQVVDAVDDGSAFGLEVAYSFDGPDLQGTGGAIRRALPLLGPEFFVLYGDSYLECDFQAVQAAYEAAGKLALMTVCHNRGLWDTSNVEFCDGLLVAYSKCSGTERMQHIDYGLGIMDRRVFDLGFDDGPLDLATVYQRMLEHGELSGFEVKERFYEIGSLTGLQETRQYLAGRLSKETAGDGNHHVARHSVLGRSQRDH
jgi:NDP-sugar pyrophosphorylase family protein